ncbi:MAG: recombinase RecT [Sulfurimonadaceae bacterium]
MSNIISREQQIINGLDSQKMLILKTIGDKAKANKFLATASKVATDAKLANCSTNSILDACITVAQLNLDLSPAIAHAYLVPFKGSVQLIVSARGYTALMARTGWKIKSYIVNEEDDFEYIIDGFDESVKFKKNIDSAISTFRLAVALAQSPDGTLYIEVMNAAQIDKHRKAGSSQTKTTQYTSKRDAERIAKGLPVGIWEEWFDEMAKKTVIKKLVKSLPMGEEIANALEKDDKPIDVEVLEDKQKEQATDLNSMLKQVSEPKSKPKAAAAQAPKEEKDLLDGIKVEAYDPKTGEVYKPNMALLDGVNADGTDDDDDGFPFGD